ncbi:MAG: LssY C-terminal domain-containing protein [Gammaproteobacteria bacterium]|jgi:hypothetical protein
MNSNSRYAEIPRQFRRPGRFVATLVICALLGLAATGCSSWQVPSWNDSGDLRARAESETIRGVRLSATVLGSEDSRQMFGTNVNATGVQPVWIEVENTTPEILWLLRSGTDPDYFSPLEVAWSFHAAFSSSANARLDDHFRAMGFPNPIPPGSKVAGILFTNPQRQTRFLSVDILGEGQVFAFSLFLPVPGDRPEEPLLKTIMGYADKGNEDFQDAGALRARLEKIPCCASSVDGSASGDPVNVVIVGEFADIVAALVRRGFRKLEMDVDAEQRLFGRAPDAVVRKSGQGGVPANWLRLWVAPFRYRGQLVFLAQAGRPIGGRFQAARGGELRLHPNVDEARDILIQDMLYSGGLERLGFANGVGAAAAGKPRDSLDGTRYFTDGLRAAMFFVTRPRSVSSVEMLDWVPYSQPRDSATRAMNDDAQN